MKQVAVTLAMVMLATGLPVAQQAQPSLGDLSRQIEAERTIGKKAAKSYTNKDLTADPNKASDPNSGEAADESVSTSADKTVSPKELVKQTEDKGDVPAGGAAMPEEHWRERGDFIRQEFARAQGRQKKLNEIPEPASLPARARLEQEYAIVRQMIDGLTKQWNRLEESARVARIPSDWIGAKPVFTP